MELDFILTQVNFEGARRYPRRNVQQNQLEIGNLDLRRENSGENQDDCHVCHTWKGTQGKHKEWIISDLEVKGPNNKNLMETIFKVQAKKEEQMNDRKDSKMQDNQKRCHEVEGRHSRKKGQFVKR